LDSEDRTLGVFAVAFQKTTAKTRARRSAKPGVPLPNQSPNYGIQVQAFAEAGDLRVSFQRAISVMASIAAST
jgi:hypothetical protein